MTAVKVDGKKLILGALASCVKSIANCTRQRDNLIARAVERGIPQAQVAKAAGMSQAHVSRVASASRKHTEERKATRAATKKNEGGTV